MSHNKQEGSRQKSSLAFKLNVRFTLHMAGAFFGWDIFWAVVMAAVLVLYAEDSLQPLFAKGTPPLAVSSTEETIDNMRLLLVPRPAQGVELPSALLDAVPLEITPGLRRVQYRELPDAKGIYRLDGIVYTIEQPKGDTTLAASFAIGRRLRYALYVLAAAIVWQLLELLFGMPEMNRNIGKILRPIQELAQAAQTLNTEGSGAFTPEEMEALADKLDSINAAKLDTRIAVDGTQKELRSLAGAINGMLDRINESYRAQIRFVSDASHELRTPIAVIQGYANLLDRWGKNDPQTTQESIEAIKEEAASMKELVEQLLFLARGDNNTMKLQQEPLNLALLAEEVVRETRMIAANHQITAQLSSAYVMADDGLMKQALRVLADNAVKYTPSGGQIQFRVEELNHQARVTVQDSGIGIPAQSVEHIFQRFYRADESRARATGGTGLGLAIAKWIVERHKGHFEVISREDIGTRITLVFPAIAPDFGAQEPTRLADAPPKPTPQKEDTP